MSYTLQRQDIYDLLRHVGADAKEKGEELLFTYCPRCHGGKHRDKHTFSLNMESGAFCCLRASCGYKGHFVELCRDFDFPLTMPQKSFKVLPQPSKHIQSSAAAIGYMQSRGISAEVTKRYEITTRKDNDTVLCFPFCDETGRLQFIKYRSTAAKRGKKRGAKEWCEKDAMPILFGMKQCVGFDRLIITEGQIDSLSVAEAGFANAVSVPTGASGFTWLAPCFDWICKFKEVIVFGDLEHGKMTLLDTLLKELPTKIKAVRKCDYLGEKDANDILQKYGVEAIRKCIANAEVPKIDSVKDLSSVRAVNMGDLQKIPTGITEIDRAIGGMVMGQVILLTGRAGEGKSTFMSQLICAALDAGEKVFAYSGELADFHFKRWIDYQLAGAENITETVGEDGVVHDSIPHETLQKINDWYKGRVFLYDNACLQHTKEEFSGLLETMEKVVRQCGVRLCCIDNLMTAMDTVDSDRDLYAKQSSFVGKLKQIAMRYSVAILLVAHPRKAAGDLTNDAVSGSADIINKADVVMAYRRADANEDADSILQITKNRLFGILKTGQNGIRLHYSKKTKRIFSAREYSVKRYI